LAGIQISTRGSFSAKKPERAASFFEPLFMIM
jgi:hypothetical protein